METMTPQEKMLGLLKRSGIPHREIKCYGSQITVLAVARETANKWAALLSKFCQRVRVKETIDYCAEEAQQNRSTLAPKTVRCFLIGATIE